MSRRSIKGEEENEKEEEEEVEVFSDSDLSWDWDWVSNMDTDADTDKGKLRIDGDCDCDGDGDGDVVDRSGVRKPKTALALTGTGAGTLLEAEESKAFTYRSARSNDVCDDDLQESVSMTMSTSVCLLSCRGLPPPPHGPRDDKNQHEMEVTGLEESHRLHTTDHKSRLSSSSMAADTAVAVAVAVAMQQKHTSDMLLISSIVHAQDSSYKKSEINSKFSAPPSRPIDKTNSIIPTSSPQHKSQEVSPHSMISYLPQMATIKSVIEPTKQQRVGPTMVEKQDKPEFPDACSHLLLPPSRESETSFIAVSMADSRLISSATALSTIPEDICSDSVGATEHSNRANLPLPLYGRAFAFKQASIAESVPMSSSLSQYHITPLLSALLLPSPPTAPTLPAATRLSHLNSSPLSVTVSTATSYPPSVSPLSNLQASEISATSVLPSPLTSPSSSVDGLSPRRGAVRAAAAATESSKKQEAGYTAPNVLTVDVQKIGEISSPVSSLSESSLPLSPYALFLQRNAAQAATAQQGLSLSLSYPAPAALVVKNAMLLSYEEEEAEYRAKHGTSWAPLSPIVYFAEPIEVDTRTRMTGNRKNIRYVYMNMMPCSVWRHSMEYTHIYRLPLHSSFLFVLSFPLLSIDLSAVVVVGIQALDPLAEIHLKCKIATTMIPIVRAMMKEEEKETMLVTTLTLTQMWGDPLTGDTRVMT